MNQLPAAGATGFRRLAVVAPDGRIDVALPENIAVSDIYPEILRLTRQSAPPPGVPHGYHLFRGDGTALDPNRSLAQQRVVDGEMLHLRPFAESLPPAVFDDVSDAVATAVARDRHRWNDGMLRTAGLTGTAAVLLALAPVLWWADPQRHDMHGLPGLLAGTAGLLLTLLGGIRARVYGDRGAAVALGLGALPLLLIAGSGIVGPDPGAGPGRLQFLLGCVCVLVASVLLIALSPDSDAPFVAGAVAAGGGALATFAAIVTEASATGAAAVCVPAAVGLIAFLPGLSARIARLPIGWTAPHSAAEEAEDAGGRAAGPADPALASADSADRPGADGPGGPARPVDADRVAAQARRGHALLLGLLGGCSAVVVVAAAVLGFTGGLWAQLLALAGGLAMLLRARLFRYTAQVTCALAAGLAATVLLVLALALGPPDAVLIDFAEGNRSGMDIRTLWLTAALLVGAAVPAVAALAVPGRGLTPFWGRLLDLAEGLLLLSLLPLCLAVLDVYGAARGMTSG